MNLYREYIDTNWFIERERLCHWLFSLSHTHFVSLSVSRSHPDASCWFLNIAPIRFHGHRGREREEDYQQDRLKKSLLFNSVFPASSGANRTYWQERKPSITLLYPRNSFSLSVGYNFPWSDKENGRHLRVWGSRSANRRDRELLEWPSTGHLRFCLNHWNSFLKTVSNIDLKTSV